MAPRKWNADVADEKDLYISGYEYIDLNGRRFEEDRVYDHEIWFSSMQSEMNRRFPQFAEITNNLHYFDHRFGDVFRNYSNSLYAMSSIVSDIYDSSKQGHEVVKAQIKSSISVDLFKLGMDIDAEDAPEIVTQMAKEPTDEFADYYFQLMSIAGKYGVANINSDLAHYSDESIHSRAFAVKGMAEMIGLGDLVPGMEAAEIYKDGKRIKTGVVFDKNAQHEMVPADIAYLTEKHGTGAGRTYLHDRPDTLENISDINVMFCLSGRRAAYISDLGYDINPKNGSVKFKFTRFDSPEDFGYRDNYDPENDPAVKAVTMLSGKRADAILKLDPVKYKKMLTKTGLGPDTVDCAMLRLNALKGRIASGQVEIVNDWEAKWQQANLKKLSESDTLCEKLYNAEDALRMVRMGARPTAKPAARSEWNKSYDAMQQPERDRLKALGDGDPRLGFYMYHMAATPSSAIYPGGGKIKAERIQKNLDELMNGDMKTADSLKLAILKEEAKARIDEVNHLSPSDRSSFERKLVEMTAAAKAASPEKYLKGSSKKWTRANTALESKVEKSVDKLRLVTGGKELTLDTEIVRKSYEAVRAQEEDLINTLGFFTRDSNAFKSLSALAALDLKKAAATPEEMQFHIQTMAELAKTYSDKYVTPEQRNMNARRSTRLTLAENLKAISEACLENKLAFEKPENAPEAKDGASVQEQKDEILLQ